MEKRSGLHAVDVEGLVLEMNVGLALNPATSSRQEVPERAQWIPAWSAAALTWENIRTNDPAASSIIH